MKNLSAALIAALIAAGSISFGAVGLAHAGPAATRSAPSGNTVVEVTGGKLNGFGVHYYDGSSIFPPTDSEAAAECSEYDTRVARVRCRTEVRTWYRDLTVLKKALNWAHVSD